MNQIVDVEDYLPLSGIQHIAFCPRQWALIHIEKQWSENLRTAQGRLLHEKADDPFGTESRRDLLVSRAIPLVSSALGLYGVADVVEFIRTDREEGISLPGRSWHWLPYPVEYKVGKPKVDDRDTVQLCAQAICLEEAYGIHIPSGYMYYGLPRRRLEVLFDTGLREKTAELAGFMHHLFSQRIIPPAKKTSKCRSCSLVNDCMPNAYRNVNDYVNAMIQDLFSDETG